MPTTQFLVWGQDYVTVGCYLYKYVYLSFCSKTKAAYNALQGHEKSGKDHEDAWNLASVQLVNASEVRLINLH